MTRRYILPTLLPALTCCLVGVTMTASFGAEPATRTAAVDSEGVLRWQDDKSEVALLGVNYYVPFSIDYQRLQLLGLDHDQAIRDDLTHFQRLGISAIRLHCWDREISDREGNLVDNEHLRLLDYLIAQCKERGIYCVMTPIAWWGAPNPGGFSDLYKMPQMTTDKASWPAQRRYLGQYMNHVNRYTGLAYKDDPAIIAIELINEPLYPQGTTEPQITEYIDTLTAAVRETGSHKPVFYNCWQGHDAAAGASTLDGCTFGWYPTGLVNGAILVGDHLPKVDDYPSMRSPRLTKKAKIVYEFDAADVHGSVMYPAMARAFRSGGGQIATQFQYEPMCIAGTNSNWQTHYLNLAYTPHKAISFAIAAEVFRRIPRLSQFGSYPANTRFGDFHLSHPDDLSEMVTRDSFLYSNSTTTNPPAPQELVRIAGHGSSPVVRYEGTGAYFLERLAPGLWKLQVYPDAVMVADPYSGGDSEKVRVLWARHSMTVTLPDLGSSFSLLACDAEGRPKPASTVTGEMQLSPGMYVLAKAGVAVPETVPGVPFVAPASSTKPPAAFVSAPDQWREGKDMKVQATVATADPVEASLRVRPSGATSFVDIPMQATRPYEYAATIPAALLKGPMMEYYLRAKTQQGIVTFPGGKAGERDEAALIPAAPARLLDLTPKMALPEASQSLPEGKTARLSLVPGSDTKTLALRFEADGFGEPPSCAGVRLPITKLPADLSRFSAVRIVARGSADTGAVEISLVQKDGNAFGDAVALGPAWREIVLPLDRLRRMWSTHTTTPDLQQLDQVSIIFGAWLYGDLANQPHAVEVQSVDLIQIPDVYRITVTSPQEPFVLLAAADGRVKARGRTVTTSVTAGMDAGKTALRLSVPGFGEPPDSASLRMQVPPVLEQFREEMAKAQAVVVKARALRPQTKSVELVLIEDDGTPWGTEVSLSQDWQAIRIPFSGLRLFTHWPGVAADRGGPGDHLRPGHVQAVSLCFGAWLYGDDHDKPHSFELQEVSLAGG